MNTAMKNLACTLILVVLMESESALGAGVGNTIAVRLTGSSLVPRALSV